MGYFYQALAVRTMVHDLQRMTSGLSTTFQVLFKAGLFEIGFYTQVPRCPGPKRRTVRHRAGQERPWGLLTRNVCFQSPTKSPAPPGPPEGSAPRPIGSARSGSDTSPRRGAVWWSLQASESLGEKMKSRCKCDGWVLKSPEFALIALECRSWMNVESRI